MKKWEYTMANFPEIATPPAPDVEELLNRMGALGWELISFVHFERAKLFQCVFKRPKRAARVMKKKSKAGRKH